jgi:hypothetical protein
LQSDQLEGFMVSVHKTSLLAAVVSCCLAAAPASAFELAFLSDNNELILASDTTPGQVRTVRITGVTGRLIGIDVRPADDTLYGVGTDNQIYRIALTGTATVASKLSEAFDAARGAVVDFNPLADRLRLMGQGGKINFRINVDTGAVLVDKPLTYGPGLMMGKAPMVTAGAYINSVKGTKETQLFDVDSGNDSSYVIQDPPNDGILTAVGKTSIAGKVDAIDIHTGADGTYTGFALANNTLHKFNVSRGSATVIGPVGGGLKLIDVAVIR